MRSATQSFKMVTFHLWGPLNVGTSPCMSAPASHQ